MNNEQIDAIKGTPMSNQDIKQYFPNVKIYMYTDLKNIQNASDLFINDKYFFILYLDSPYSGHWCCCANNKNDIYFFDSYGYAPDKQLNFTPEKIKRELGTNTPYLTDLFNKSNYDIYYNDVDYQGRKNLESQTCGRFCCFFLSNFLKGMKLDDFYEYMRLLKKRTGKTYNEIVSMVINQ
jgi:hypothetical protein